LKEKGIRFMKIEFMLSIDDWVAFSLNYLETSPEGKNLRSSGQTRGSIIICLIGIFFAVYFLSFWPFLIGLLAVCVWYFIWPKMLQSSQSAATERRHRESKNPCLNGAHLLELTPVGLHASCDVSDTVIKWSGIARVESNSTHGFVYLRNNTGYVIPQGKVRDGDFAIFMANMQQRLQEQSANIKSRV